MSNLQARLLAARVTLRQANREKLLTHLSTSRSMQSSGEVYAPSILNILRPISILSLARERHC
jgi:hypothetical protein